MRRHWFFILLSLAERDRHGSGVMRDVLELTEGELKLWPVTLYGSLDELRDQGVDSRA
jgi:DNA-binding PadR family transcriptional regulator